MRLEGLVRGAGVHAAGVVIAPKPLTELVPVTRTKNDAIVTSYDMKAIEKMGLLKMDFLGLTTLTVIDDALKLIKSTTRHRRRHGDDPARRRAARTSRSSIARSPPACSSLNPAACATSAPLQAEHRRRPDRPERALPARPDRAMIDDFIERKWGRRAVEYDLPELETILRETSASSSTRSRSCRSRNVIAGYSLGDADLLRRAMGKKDADGDGEAARALHGRRGANKHPKDVAGKIFDLMEQFAGYGFNKSHSAAYALLAYHTAWLKTHYPVEFMAALLTSETSKPENVVKYIAECREMNIPVVPPNVQVSDANFTPIVTRQARPSASAWPPSRTSATTPSSRSSHAREALQSRREAGLRQPVGVLRKG